MRNGAWLPRVPFAYSGGTWTLTGGLVVNGNLTVEGATTTISTLNLLIEDKIITINTSGTTAGAVGAGLEIEGDAGAVVGYIKTGAADNSIFTLKAPGNASILTLDLNATKTWTVGGALNVEADSNINQDCTTDASVAHADLTLTKAGIVTTGTMALLATNTTAATVGVPVQYSPDIRLVGHAWETTGSTDDTHTWAIRNVPSTGATSSSKLSFLQATDAGALTEKVKIDSDGGLFGANFYCGLDAKFYLGRNSAIFGASANSNYLYSSEAGVSFALVSSATASGTSIGCILGTWSNLNIAGDKIVSFINNNTEKAYIDKDGGICPTVDGAALPGAAVGYRGQIRWVAGGAGARDRAYICLKSDAGAYSWVQVVDGGA